MDSRPKTSCVPVIQSDGFYMLADVRRSFGLSDRQLAEWKRHPDFFAIQLPGGDAISGADLIEWLRANRRKKHPSK